MSYESRKFVKVTISSHKSKLSGQNHRCSNNFDLSQLKDTGELKFTFSGVKTISLAQDKTAATDKTIKESLESGNTVEYKKCGKDSVYIMDVVSTSGTEGMFSIVVEAV